MAGSGIRTAAATVVLRLPASPAHVRTARLVAAAMARRSGLDETLLDEVRLAVGEACARAVRQHERFGLTEPITLEFGDKGRFSVAVIDRAPPADRTDSAPGPPAASAAPGAASHPVPGPPRSAAVTSIDVDTFPTVGAGSAPPARSGLDRTAADPAVGPGWQGLAATADALGLALLDAVAQDVVVTELDLGAGTCITMSWPLGG